MKLGPVVQEEMLLKQKLYGRTDRRMMHDGRQTKTDHNTSPRVFGSGELKSQRLAPLKKKSGSAHVMATIVDKQDKF